MPNKCFVPGCNNNYKSSSKKGSQFHPPEGQLEIWNKAIPRYDRDLTYKDVVCEGHFKPEDVISTNVLRLPDGTVYEEVLKRKALKDGASPCIFTGTCQGVKIPKYLTNRKSVRKSPKKRYGPAGSGRSAAPVASLENVLKRMHPVLESLKLKLPKLLADSLSNPAALNLPENWKVIEDKENLSFVHSPSGEIFEVDRSISFKKQQLQSPPELKFKGKHIDLQPNLVTEDDMMKLIREVDRLKACPGSADNKRHKQCAQYIKQKVFRSIRCKFCQRERKKILQVTAQKSKQVAKAKKKIKLKRDKIYRMKKKILSLQEEIKKVKKEMSSMAEEAVQKLLDSIQEEKHKVVVKAVIMASKCKHPKTRRYSNEWMYECILMRIKSPALYRKMLRDNLLPPPSFRTIQRFLQKMKPQFGFHEPTFKLMAEKAKSLSKSERHGTLMLDEMAMEENIAFNQQTGQVHGMVDLGSATPPHAGCILGDHALVFAFEPFKGQWFQSIGAFCSKGAAKGPELEKLTNEAIMLLAKHHYYVDVVTSDGGSWNRNMWALNGINAEQVSCLNPAAAGDEADEVDDPEEVTNAPADVPSEEAHNASTESHPQPNDKSTEESIQSDHRKTKGKDKNRRLWYVSDFPHLMKSMWSRVRTSGELETPEGTVKLEHWQALADIDDEKFTHINVCHKLTHDHIDPSNWQAMNVKMAFQFFCEDVAIAMEHYRDVEKVPELQDCHATCEFIRKIHRLGKAMNARHSWDSLRYDKDNEAYKAITEFLNYLDLWKKKVPEADSRFAWQTELGLKVTLKATLQLCKYLTEELGFDYLMTARLNQDPLEHFFGKLRQACGANDHPDPQQFIQVYRLLSVASLIKPPRGSNVSGGEMLKTLTSLTDILTEENDQRRSQLEEQLDKILDRGDEEGIMANYLQSAEYIESTPAPSASEHGYGTNTKINPYAFQMFAGYVARKARQQCTAKKCEECFNSLTKETDDIVPAQYLIDKRSRGFLLKASSQLYNFLVKIENNILKVLSTTKMNRNILLDVVDALDSSSEIQSEVGCDVHKRQMTKDVLLWYLNTRMIFACKRHMKTQTSIKKRKKKAKSLLKKVKLNAIPVDLTGELEQSQSRKKKVSKGKKVTAAVAQENPDDPSVMVEFGVEFEEPPPERSASKVAEKPINAMNTEEAPKRRPEAAEVTPAKKLKAAKATVHLATMPVSSGEKPQRQPPQEFKKTQKRPRKLDEATPKAEPPKLTKVPKVDVPCGTSRSGRSRKANKKFTDYEYY